MLVGTSGGVAGAPRLRSVPAWISIDSADRSRSAIRDQASSFDTKHLLRADQYCYSSYYIGLFFQRTNRTQLVSPTEAEREFVISLGHWSAGPGPLYQRLAQALHAAIEREIPVGATLPPERRLAELLHVSRTTVVATYRILRREGCSRAAAAAAPG